MNDTDPKLAPFAEALQRIDMRNNPHYVKLPPDRYNGLVTMPQLRRPTSHSGQPGRAHVQPQQERRVVVSTSANRKLLTVLAAIWGTGWALALISLLIKFITR
jgi:hypothetical protein